jgi:hypothetical protein
MTSQPMTLLVIISETVLEDILLDEIMDLGAKGYTITDARGRGHTEPAPADGPRAATSVSKSSAMQRCANASSSASKQPTSRITGC